MAKSIATHSSLALTPEEILVNGFKVPTGTVSAFAGTVSSLPMGWLHCDGTSLVRADYQELFNVIGTAHGAADGTHFNIPDLRGLFVRGWNGAASNDPDAALRTSPRTGANTGNNVGSIQADMFGSHSHTINAGNAGGGLVATSIPFDEVYDQPGVIGNSGGNETRPKNVGLLYIIKY